MAATAKKTDPALWERVKEEITRSDKGGEAGQWSARKAQLAVQAYKARGGGYEGRKSKDNHLQQWQNEDWGTKSGRKSGETGERYLPKEARAALSKEEYARTTAKKRADKGMGRQFSGQPADVAKKTARYRHHDGDGGGGVTRAELYAQAQKRKLPGRSKMSKAELARALHA